MHFEAVKGIGGQEKIIARLDENNSCEVYLKGAHISSWVCNGQERFFLSSVAQFEGKSALRGGVPVIFPQFSDMGPMMKHGFGRIVTWRLDEQSHDSEQQSLKLTLVLEDTPETLQTWPFHFSFHYSIILSVGKLEIRSSIQNVGETNFEFQFALHSYFLLSDINDIQVSNLKDLKYMDNCKKREIFTHQEEVLDFQNETDVIFLNAPNHLQILSQNTQSPLLTLIKSNSNPDAVVWNPWIEKTRGIGDLEDDDYKRFVCIEAGAISSPPSLSPNEKWESALTLIPN